MKARGGWGAVAGVERGSLVDTKYIIYMSVGVGMLCWSGGTMEWVHRYCLYCNDQ